MGGPKSNLLVGGQPALVRLHERLCWEGPTLLIRAHGGANPPGAELFDAVAADAVEGQGPLRGVLTALENAVTPMVVVVPVDMPAIEPSGLRFLIDQLRGSPSKAGMMMCRRVRDVIRFEPFPAVFRRAAAVTLIRKRIAARDQALHRLTESPQMAVRCVPPGLSEQFWTNLNFPDDLTAYENVLKVGSTS
jgi:molybdopterin-guanine dinucleotide biosynthesis protein A